PNPSKIQFKDGEIADQVVGYQPKEALTELIAKHA
ncbi:thiol reductase thioredoxin, partial [Peribacillus butanolivorans]